MEDTIYDTETLEAMESFHRVWSRVSAVPSPRAGIDPLPNLLTTLWLLHRHYALLAKAFSGHAQPRRMAQETAIHYRRLLAEHYIREGHLWTPETQPLPRGKRPLLRSAILLEESLIRSCDSANAPELLQKLSAASSVRKAAVKELLITCF